MIFPVCFTISWSISTSWLNSNFGCFGSQCFAFADPCFVTYTEMMFPSKIPMKHGFPWILAPRLSDSWGHHWLSGISMVKHANSSELIRKLGINPLGRFSWLGGLFECNVLQRCLYMCVCVFLLSTVKPPSMSKVLTHPISMIFATGNHVFHHYLSWL